MLIFGYFKIYTNYERSQVKKTETKRYAPFTPDVHPLSHEYAPIINSSLYLNDSLSRKNGDPRAYFFNPDHA